ncbi:uncharacterized protein KD926_008076 [Aspergillus affinis]|uniref:uncharacterized protein n=1 Tax=Aspergillus affinis TaxID=1070780 RepID=UPI0022FE77D6|nr:uncharacterized protein KD926_008076 [Aspergillus affinis]KAI9045659.1 hypothetical protein KD926_008076 [Aspergillus affinis]
MARPFNPYEPELNQLSNKGSPMSPYPRGDTDTPLSFKTNVNRSKTKRWVEAKKFSYDGNDWGDDEYGEYDDDDYEEPPPLPQSTHMNQSTPGISKGLSRDRNNTETPPLPSMDRSRSMDQVMTLGVNDAGDSSRSRSVDRTVPIVRPAEIYNRLRGNTAERAQAPGPGLTTGDSAGVGPPQTNAGAHGDQQVNQSLDSGTQSGSNTPKDGLPDANRLPGFGTNLKGESDLRTPTDGTNQTQPEYQLHHNPSLGFRSVVHQAFDVPETPSSTLESVGRSNSDSTSVISPIIGQRTTSDSRTPTIVEEPESTTPPKGFKPGHRRDLSVPSPGNSPSRKPEITNNDAAPPPALAEMSHNIREALWSPSPTSPEQTRGEEGMPAPLKLSNSSTPVPNEAAAIPVIVPSMSSDNSPQDTENDRLRKEIIRSLSRENTPSEEPESHENSRPQTSRQESLIPSEYERYWSEDLNSSPQEAKSAAPAPIPAANPSPDMYSSSPQQSSLPAPAAREPGPDAEHKLQRKFSWESSTSSDDMVPPAVLQTIAPEPMPGQFPGAPEVSSLPDAQPATRELDDSDHEDRQQQPTPEKPRLSIITPTLPDNRSITSDRQLPEVVDAETVAGPTHMEDEYQTPAEHPVSFPPPRTSSSSGPTPLGFREIMGKPTSNERVQAFNETREQFSMIDTGLSHWIQVTVHAHPEHSDVVEQSFKLSTGEPKLGGSRGKFPKLPSLGTFATSGGQDPSPSGSGHVRRPSAPLGSMMNKQQVEQRGKDLLHSAGMLGGQAGKTAKSLFAKGRSKFKGGGGDKGFQSFRGKRCNLRLSEMHLWPDIDVAALNEDATHDPRNSQGLKSPQRQIRRKPLPAIAKNPATLRRKPAAATTKNLRRPLPPQGSSGRSSISSLDEAEKEKAAPSLFHRPNLSSLSVPLGRFAPCRLVADRDRDRDRERPLRPRPRPSSLPRLQLTMPKERNPLGRLFGRHKADRPQSMEHLPTSTPRTRDLLGKADHLSVPRPHSFQGQPPPLGGYFAPDAVSLNVDSGSSPASPPAQFHSPPLTQGYAHSHSQSYSHPHSRTYSHSNPHLHRLSNSLSFTNSNNSSQVSLQPSLYRTVTPQFQPENNPASSPSRPHSARSRGRSPSPERTYAQDLHLRSRSPKAFAPRPQERVIPRTDPNDPAYHLGTFRSNPRTSRIGDQERPWKLTIPGMEGDGGDGEGEEEDGTLLWLKAQGQAHIKAERELEMRALNRTISGDSQDMVFPSKVESRPDVSTFNSNGKLPSYEEEIARHPPLRSFPSSDEKATSAYTSGGTSTEEFESGERGERIDHHHPTRGQARVLNRTDMPVELPVKGEDESTEEIVMSSTAYPGQEWKPLGLGEWEY